MQANVAEPLEPSAINLALLTGVLRASLSGDNVAMQQATTTLLSLSTRPKYAICLMQLLATLRDEASSLEAQQLSHMAAITFKNHVLRKWTDDPDADEVSQHAILCKDERAQIRQHIVELMLSQPRCVQQQLTEAIVAMSLADFPGQWSTLLPDLVSRFSTSNDPMVVHNILEVLHAICRRYRTETKSQMLWEEIAYVLEQVALPLTHLIQKVTGSFIATQERDRLVPILILLAELFLSLNSQDVAAQFEDENVKPVWFSSFQATLGAYKVGVCTSTGTINCDGDDGGDDDIPSPMEQLCTSIFKVARLFTWRYEEQVQEFVPQLVGAVWPILSSVSTAPRYDTLVQTALGFLGAVAKRSAFQTLFADTNMLNAICQQLVLPQMRVRQTDLELLDDNPFEFLRMDVEGGSDADTRRRSALNLVRALRVHFDATVSSTLLASAATLLNDYAQKHTPESFDTAICIVVAVGVGSFGDATGSYEPNSNFQAVLFYQTHILPQLVASAAVAPLVLAGVMKFLDVFRRELTAVSTELTGSLFDLVGKQLANPHTIVHTYAAHVINQMLLQMQKQRVQMNVGSLLQGLFMALSLPGSDENEFVMRAIVRACACARDGILPMVGTILDQLKRILGVVVQNPRSPLFNHNLFETIGVLVKHVCVGTVANKEAMVVAFEGALLGVYKQMLDMDDANAYFGSYVYQLLAQMLEVRSDLTSWYIAFWPGLLARTCWANAGNVPSLTRLMQAYLTRPSAGTLLTPESCASIAGIAQQLFMRISHHGHAFNLMQTLAESNSNTIQEACLLQMLRQCVLPRLASQAKKTMPFLTRSVHLLLTLVARPSGPGGVMTTLEQIQAGLWLTLLDKVILPHAGTQQISRNRLPAAHALLLCLTHISVTSDASRWARVCLAIAIILSPPTLHRVTGDDDEAAATEEEMDLSGDDAFTTGYARLVFASRLLVAPKSISGQTYQQQKSSIITLFQQCILTSGEAGGSRFATLSPDEQQTLQQFFKTNNVRVA